MFYKKLFGIIFIFIFLVNYSFASYKEVGIGKIDDYYKAKISKDELINIINEIEYKLESQLDTNIFDYNESKNNINIIYLPPSILEKRIKKQVWKIKKEQNKLKKLEEYFLKNDKKIEKEKVKFEKKNSLHNQEIKKFNTYVKNINQKKSLSSSEYEKEKAYIEKEKNRITKETKILKSQRKIIKRLVNNYNQKLLIHNNLVKKFNSLNIELERMNRSFKKIKGKTFGQKETKLKTFYKDGKKIQEKSVINNMNKIEIYGFDNLSELKTILAHEIMHLVGIPHINKENSLMHPILQKQQLENINLTYDDIINFKKHF